jgi:hypothetical protein
MSWGDKGEEYRPELCRHESDDGCLWCCERCNYDRHYCPNCGTIADHKETPCEPCIDFRTGRTIVRVDLP